MPDPTTPNGPSLAAYDIVATLPPSPGQPTRLVAGWALIMMPSGSAAKDWARIEVAEAVFSSTSTTGTPLRIPITKEDLPNLIVEARQFPG